MSLSSELKGCWTTVERPPRRVYIDAGANWANTLRLYRDELHKLSRFPVERSTSSQPWEIYAFEASPVIQPFVEDFVKHLNGLAPRPALLVPPIGSSRSHAQYSSMFNCTSTASYGVRKVVMFQCLFDRFERHILNHIRSAFSNESTAFFQSPRLIEKRLKEALEPNNDPAGRPRYTFIPAAIGSQNGWLDIKWSAMQQFFPLRTSWSTLRRARAAGMPLRAKVRSIDFVQWLCDSFQPSDHVVLKLDIEGGEHSILTRMLLSEPSLRSYELVDLFTGECHSQGRCKTWRRHYKNGTIPHKGMTAFRAFLFSKSVIPEWDNYSRPADQLVPIASSCPPAGSNLEWPCRTP